uniref:Major facilitator superfamily (MFS) profile domain-containing protein n=1 Tax=Bombyx mori TaxID=7091 RepID=A0A8R2MAJ7_BOMMO|nr:tetracycline resistance protein, class C-like [Bombyx mori]
MRTRSRSTVRPLWPPPVLLASLLGATIDYAIMATTPVLWILYAGRIVAGITGATGAVAGAYIADITDGEDRARHFGLMSACFGVGMVAGQVPAALWVIFGEDRFRWSATMIGLSLAVFGILHALAQAFVTGPATKRFGEKQAIIAGMAADALGYVLLAFATRGWMAFPIMILLASGGIGMPALQAMLSRQVDDDHQGQLQGSLAALTSLTSIIGPLIVTAIYAASASTWNGLAWIVGAALYLVCLPALRRGAWSRATST